MIGWAVPFVQIAKIPDSVRVQSPGGLVHVRFCPVFGRFSMMGMVRLHAKAAFHASPVGEGETPLRHFFG